MADEITDPVDTATPAETSTPASDTGTLSAAEQERIFNEEFERISNPEPTNEKPVEDKPKDEERPRGPDGKFLPKDTEPAATEPVVEQPAVQPPTATPAAETKPQPAIQPSSTGPLFDVDAMIASVQAEVNAMEIDDVGGAKTTGELALKEYGQIADPIMARQDKMFRALAEKITEVIRPALEVAQARQYETAQNAVQSTMDALVADGVSDAAQLIADPRMIEFVNKNPHYAQLMVADVNRIEDIKFVMSKFRAANGIAAPSGVKKPTTAATIQRPRPNGALQAAASTARGNGSAKDEGGSITGTPDQIMRAEFERLERLERQAGTPSRI